jgi:hypothetical protein
MAIARQPARIQPANVDHESARKPYQLKDGTAVPSVTTVLARYKESGGLMWWAYKQGKDGKELYEKTAQHSGTLAHAMVEADIKGWPEVVPGRGYTEEEIVRAHRAKENYLHWKHTTRFELVASEVRLVSETYGFGGTIDVMLELNGQLELGDLKTGKRVYRDALMQMAAYSLLWNENCQRGRGSDGHAPHIGGYHLLHFTSLRGDFSHHYFDELKLEQAQFLRYLECYKHEAELDERMSS